MLDPAIQDTNRARDFCSYFCSWMAAHVLGLDPGIKGGHDKLRLVRPGSPRG